jgi:hypothetical protein
VYPSGSDAADESNADADAGNAVEVHAVPEWSRQATEAALAPRQR